MKLFIALFAALLLSATSAADARGYNYGGGHHSANGGSHDCNSASVQSSANCERPN